MKKTLLTLALVALTTVASYAQGTIAFGNGTFTRVQIRDGATSRNALAADGLNFYVFFGAAGATDPAALSQVQQATPASIGTVDGIMINAPGIFQLPGTEPGQVVSLQIRAWNSSRTLVGETDIRQVTLAPTAGPGTVIWQTAAGTVTTRFTPLIIVPEPSTIALAVLGLGSLLLFRRRK